MGQNVSKQLATKHTQVAQAANRNAYFTADGASSPFTLSNRQPGNFMSILGKGNDAFFKIIGLEALTNLARRYAYNVGAIDSHKTAQRFVNKFKGDTLNINNIRDNSLLADVNHLIKTGVISVDSNSNVRNLSDVIAFGRAKNLTDAMNNNSSRTIIDRVGNKAANRDAIIPQVGNRLLFTQHRDPMIRMLGQFSSWAMAKSAQTNAMIGRIENAELRTAIGMLGALAIFGGVQDIREFVKTGELNTIQELEEEPDKWLAFAGNMSGNLGWLPTTAVNQLAGYGSSRPVEFFPAMSIASNIADGFAGAIGGILNKEDYDRALRNFYEVLPAPTVRAILDRAGVPLAVYKKGYNVDRAIRKNPLTITTFFNKGGAVSQARKLFSEGDVVQQTVEPSDYQYDLKTEPDTNVYDKEELNTLINEGPKIVPKKKPVLNTVSANQVYNYLINEKKLDKNKSLGIVANIYGESNFRMDADEAGDGSKGIGLFQHTFPTRKEGLLKTVPDYKTNWKGQIDYALSENEAKGYLNTDFKTAEDAAQYFMINNLRPAEEVREGRTKKHNEYLKSFEDKLNFRYGGYAAMRRAMTSNRAYSGSSGSTNRERYIASSNQSKPKTIISSGGSTNRERYIASQSGGGGNNRGNQSNTNTSSTTTTTTTNTGPVDSGGGSSTDKKDNDKVKKLLKKTGKTINRFVAENTNLLPENYEEAMSLAYGGARAGVGKVFDLGNNVYAGANITAQTGGILKGDTTILTPPISGTTTTVPTEVPDVDKSNVLDKSSIAVTGAIGGEYGFGTASFDTKEGVTLGYDYTGDTKMFTPSILGKDISIGITPNVEATFKPFEDGDNFDAKLGATVTTPIGGADVFVTEEGKFGIGKSFNFKSGGLLDKKRG